MVTTGVNNDGEFVADVTIGGKKTRLGSGRTLKDYIFLTLFLFIDFQKIIVLFLARIIWYHVTNKLKNTPLTGVFCDNK
jgi:hypothetical protein